MSLESGEGGEQGEPSEFRYDVPEGQHVCVAVTDAVAAAGGVDLDTSDVAIGDIVDIEALQRVLDDVEGRPDATFRATFRYRGYRVTLASDRTVSLQELPTE
jgi:hypothetical protein